MVLFGLALGAGILVIGIIVALFALTSSQPPSPNLSQVNNNGTAVPESPHSLSSTNASDRMNASSLDNPDTFLQGDLKEEYRLVAAWGNITAHIINPEDVTFVLPESVGVDSESGLVYVGDQDSIKEFSLDGQFIRKWNSSNSDLYNPHIAVDREGIVYALYDSGGTLHKYDSGGHLIQTIETIPATRAIAVDNSGFIYIGENTKSTLYKYDNNGTLLTSWKAESADIFGIAVDSQGSVYVVDLAGSAVLKFTNDGKLLWKNGNFERPLGIALTNDESFVYVTDFYGHTVKKLNTKDGTIASTIGSHCSIIVGDGCIDPDGASGPLQLGDGQFDSPSAVAVDSGGFVYVAERGNERVQKFSQDNKFIDSWGRTKTFDGLLSFPEGIAIDKSGNNYIAGGNYNRIQKFSSNGTFLTKWGFSGSEPGKLNFPKDIAVSPDDKYVYVADTKNHRVQKFTTEGRFIAAWDSFAIGNADPQSFSPSSIDTDSQGNVYVFDSSASLVLRLDSDGKMLTSWGGSCTLYGYTVGWQFPTKVPAGHGCTDPDGPLGPLERGDGQFLSGNIAINPIDGYIYVDDGGNKRIQIFTPDGKLVTKLGNLSGTSIVIDSEGNLYLANATSDTVKKFDSNQSLIAVIHADLIEDFAVAKDASVYVLSGNNVLKFSKVS